MNQKIAVNIRDKRKNVSDLIYSEDQCIGQIAASHSNSERLDKGGLYWS